MSDKNLAMIRHLVKKSQHFFCFQLMPPGGQSKNRIKINRLRLTPRPKIPTKYWVVWYSGFPRNVWNMDGPNEQWHFELWPLRPWKVCQTKNLYIMLCILTTCRCMSDKNLETIQPLVIKAVIAHSLCSVNAPWWPIQDKNRIMPKINGRGMVTHPAPTYPQNIESFLQNVRNIVTFWTLTSVTLKSMSNQKPVYYVMYPY
jgi:hypothetical protein